MVYTTIVTRPDIKVEFRITRPFGFGQPVPGGSPQRQITDSEIKHFIGVIAFAQTSEGLSVKDIVSLLLDYGFAPNLIVEVINDSPLYGVELRFEEPNPEGLPYVADTPWKEDDVINIYGTDSVPIGEIAAQSVNYMGRILVKSIAG